MSHKFNNVTAYACVLSDTFSLQEDIILRYRLHAGPVGVLFAPEGYLKITIEPVALSLLQRTSTLVGRKGKKKYMPTMANLQNNVP